MISKVCVIIAAYNASETVGGIVAGALKHVSRVIVADDGSTDTTESVVAEAGAEVIAADRNTGKGNALRTLFQRAMEEGYEAVISIDADGQHDPEEIPQFIAMHTRYPEDIISGSRMHEKEKIPRARYNSMLIARFYISLAANQFLDDTQCGFRLYPLSFIKKMRLMTEKFVTETEVLMKAGDSGLNVRFVNIKTIYGGGSHFKPITDLFAITAYVISYLYVKWIIEGVTSDNPNTYAIKNDVRDTLAKNKTIDRLFQGLTLLTTLPVTVFFLFEYVFLEPFIPNNFASLRKRNFKFARITRATLMLPVLIGIVVTEKIAKTVGFTINVVDSFIERYFSY